MKMHLDVHKYNEYCEFCKALNVEPLTFDEIYECVEESKMVEHAKEIEDSAEKLGNAGSALVGGFNKLWNTPAVQRTVNEASRAAYQTGKSFIQGMSWGSGANAVVDFAADQANRYFGGGGNSGGGNSGGGKANTGGVSSNHTLNSLQFKDKPLELKLDTGILNRVWTSPILSGTKEFASMHMTNIEMSLEALLDNGDVMNYFNKAFYTKLLNFAQAKVNFSVATLEAFSQDNVRKYFDAVIDGLNCYFYYVSIMGYFENPKNNNYAMIDLRNRITPEMLNQLVILRRLLTTFPIPPKLMNFIYYLNGNFKANSVDGCALIKFETSELEEAYITTMTDKLKKMEKTASLMSRIFPEWLYEDLPTYPGTGFHDWNFNTIWTNAPYTVEVQGLHQQGPFPFYEDDQSIVYQTFSSDLDGASMAVTTIYDSTQSAFVPGFVKPRNSKLVTTEQTSRVSWDDTGWVNSGGNTNLAASRMDTYPACAIGTGTLLDPQVKSQCEPVRSVNINTVRQAHFDFIDFMASFDSIKQSGESMMNDKAKRNRRHRRK